MEMAKKENAENKVELFMKFAGNSAECNVHDPYYGDISGFEKVFSVIDDHCNKIVDRILQSQPSKTIQE
jgi:protein-tyrosine phosphatase